MYCVSNPALGLLIYFLYYPGATIQEDTKHWLIGYISSNSPTYYETTDTQSYGEAIGFPRRALSGQSYQYQNAGAGSRAIDCRFVGVQMDSVYAARGCNKREYPGASWDGNTTYLDGYASWPEAPVYSEFVDGETKYGRSIGLPRRLFIGGTWYHDSNCGSRSILSYCFSSNVSSDIATRGCKER